MRLIGILGVLALLVSVSTVMAESISGQVVDSSGSPKRGLAVVLENQRGQWITGTSTDRSGAFTLTGVPRGRFRLKVFSGNDVLWTTDVDVSGRVNLGSFAVK
jgi:hypothetical protein